MSAMKENTTIYNDDCLSALENIGAESIDCIVTDPPYELNFMGKGWDKAGVSFDKKTWEKCLNVLKPGGYLLAFGGSRTCHRIACAIEDAGFEIRDTIMWLYGSGFPKGMALDKSLEAKLTTGNANKTEFHKLSGVQEDKHNYGFTTANKEQGIRPKDYTTEGASNQYLKELEPTTELAKKYKGWKTALKPSFEPIIVARKPFKGSLVDNVIEYGVGGINIDECRVGNEKLTNKGMSSLGVMHDDNWVSNKEVVNEVKGRFPANTILTYDETDFEEVCGGFPNSKSGSATRYFYCAKASKRDRDEGLEGFSEKTKVFNGKSGESSKEMKDVEQRFTTRLRNIHPTVKPTSLMQYLVRLVAPKGATILDPFMGSGSTGKAVMFENKDRNADYKFIGIEKDPEYCKIAIARIKAAGGVYDE